MDQDHVLSTQRLPSSAYLQTCLHLSVHSIFLLFFPPVSIPSWIICRCNLQSSVIVSLDGTFATRPDYHFIPWPDQGRTRYNTPTHTQMDTHTQTHDKWRSHTSMWVCTLVLHTGKADERIKFRGNTLPRVSTWSDRAVCRNSKHIPSHVHTDSQQLPFCNGKMMCNKMSGQGQPGCFCWPLFNLHELAPYLSSLKNGICQTVHTFQMCQGTLNKMPLPYADIKKAS